MRICEYRQIGHVNTEIFRIFGTSGTFRENTWVDKATTTTLSVEDRRDPLPPEVDLAFRAISPNSAIYGAHGGSQAYLGHEFVDAIAPERLPAINIWEAVRYMAAGVIAHQSALRDGELLDVPDWGDAPHTYFQN